MNTELALQIQAWIDGELPPDQQQRVAQRIASDPEADALRLRLEQTRQLLAGNESTPALPVTPDYFWSQIERRLASADVPPPAPFRTPAASWWSAWWKVLAPAAILLALVPILLRQQPALDPRPAHTFEYNAQFEVASEHPGASVITYQSDTDGLTVVWVDSR